MATFDDARFVSAALLGAALAGLVSVAGCVSDGGAPSDPDTPIPDTACSSGVSQNPVITSSTKGTVTLADFRTLCTSKDGIFETQPHCGGSNACRGISYDSETETLIEHTCRATNSCAGYSCVVCDGD